MKDLHTKHHTLPSPSTSSSSSSSSSSDFEFILSLSPTSRNSSLVCPADELFYKGQLLPLHLSPRLSMVRTLLASSSTSSSSYTATASRDSTGSSNSSSSYSCDLSFLADLDSARPSSATEDDNLKNPTLNPPKKSKYFSLSRFSSVFLRKDNVNPRPTSDNSTSNPSKRTATSAKELIRKYAKKVRPLYKKFTPNQSKMATTDRSLLPATNLSGCSSLSGNLRYTRRRSGIVCCPSSMRSSLTHSGVLCSGPGLYSNSSMDELQSAIEGAITHCKNSMRKKGSE